ncbi:MAG: hypothetical protein PSX80_02220 [bacterium]|nr:hypothetical protein [bacterium]
MLIRAIALSLALVFGAAVIVPVATESVEAGRSKKKQYKKKSRNWKGVKKYSKRWWALYRAQERRKKTMNARRRALRLRQMRLAKVRQVSEPRVAAATKPVTAESSSTTAMLPSGQPAPAGWQPGSKSSSEVQFSVDGGRGTAAISVVGPASGETVDTGRNRAVGGVPTSALRREVINRMIQENGWVVNDFQKEVGNKKVYVVVAQSQGAGGRLNSRMFYFTEVDGRIYSLATNTNVDSADRIAEESEKVLNSLQPRGGVQRAATRE